MIRPLNVLIIHWHDCGRYLSPQNDAVPKPNVARLAARSTEFSAAYAAAPTCSPSRAALLTGRYPHETGMVGLAHRGFACHDYSGHLARTLATRGWESVLCGVQHEAPRKSMLGYETILGPRDDYFAVPPISLKGYDDENARQVARFLREREDERPFFLFWGLLNAHRPFPEPRFLPASAPAGLPATEEVRRDYGAFLSGIGDGDAAMAHVVDALDELDLWSSTIVVLTTDHGPAFPGMKADVNDGGTGVTLLARVPEEGSAYSRIISEPVSHLDVAPTILDAVGIERPAGLHGRILPVRATSAPSAETPDRPLFAETTFHVAYEPARAVRTDRFRLIVRFDPGVPRPSNVDDSPSKEAAAAIGYFDVPRSSVELYDLTTDPEERVNVAEDTRYRETRRTLEETLYRWMTETDDPLLDGAVIPPVGAVVGPPDAWSPS